MIKEYPVIIVDTITDSESESVMAFDLSKIIAIRPFVDANGDEQDDKCIFYFSYDTSFVVIVNYGMALKDWEDARGVKIIRLVSI